MMRYLFRPLLHDCARQGPYHDLYYRIKPCFCISVSLCLWWSSWGPCDLGTTIKSEAFTQAEQALSDWLRGPKYPGQAVEGA